jgi:putative transposase
MVNRRIYQLDHCTYRCEYHIVWVCKYRVKALADNYIKQEMGRIIKQICRWKGFMLRAWHLGDEHIHLVISIPPKYSIADEHITRNYVRDQQHHQVEVLKLPL